MNARKPIVHSPLHPHRAESTEYFLPQPVLPDDVPKNLQSWMLTIATSSTPEIARIIDERFAAIEHKALRPLCGQLRSYSPVSLIVRGSTLSWLRLDAHQSRRTSCDLRGRVIGSSAYLPSLPDERRIQEQLALTGFSKNEVFSAFALSFCGLAEDYEISGSFLEDNTNWFILGDNWQEEAIANYHEWQGSLLFYHARNGDHLLLCPSGQVGWWKHAEGLVSHAFDSFTLFLEYYVKYRDDFAWPFSLCRPCI